MEIRQILDGAESLEMVMPEFQREYVWTINAAKSLMISLYKGYPTGSLLFWETETPPEIKNKAVDVNKLGLTKVILDGQQRLTTLYLLIKGEIPPYYTDADFNNNDPRHLHFNVFTGEFQFHMKSKMDSNPFWNSVIDCFDEEKVEAFTISDAHLEANEDANYKEITRTISSNLTKLRLIKKQHYPIQTVPKTATIDEAIDVFDLVNSKGTKLTDAELVLTHFTGTWAQARRVMKEKIRQMEDVGFELNLDLLTRMMVVTLTHSALYNKNAKLKYDNFTEEDYKSVWGKISKALDYLIPILQQDGLISSTNDMNTNNVLVPIVFYLVNHDNKFTGKLKYQFLYWMFQSLIWSRYSGQTDQRLDKDIHIIDNQSDFIEVMLDEIRDQRGRLEVKPSDLEGRGAGHALYKMLYIVTKANKAIDWANGGAIYGTIGDYYSIQSHHIFPQAYLYREKYDSQNHLDKKRVNEIANRAFITRDTNYYISDTAPIEYLPEIEKVFPNALKKQFIPSDRSMWTSDNYESFLETRRQSIADEINGFLQKLWDHESDNGEVKIDTIQSWESMLNAGDETNFIEFKSTLRYCLRNERPEKYIEFSIAKTLNAFLNSEGGTLIIGVDDAGEVLGLDNDITSFGDKGKDGFLLHCDNLVNNYLGKEQQADISISLESIDGKDICVVEVSASNKPVFINKDGEKQFYVRNSASSQPYDMSEAVEYINKHWTK
jgi:hypothetical protein